MNFRQPLWMISIGHLLGIACMVLGITAVFQGLASPLWLLLWPFFHILDSLMLSVGLHRYFSHGAFKVGKFWHKFMVWYSVLLLNGSPQGWATAHLTHHIHSDTDRDPHLAVPSYLIWKRYRNVPMYKGRLRKFKGDRDLAFVHRYGMALWLAFAVITLLISWKLFVFGYGMALGSVHVIGALHQVISHKDNKPRNLPWLEFVLPAMGEWMHATHHKYGGRKDMRTAWWHLDLGYWFIRLIEKR